MSTEDDILARANVAQVATAKQFHELRRHVNRANDKTIQRCIVWYTINAENLIDPEGSEQNLRAAMIMKPNERKMLLYDDICSAAASRDFSAMVGGVQSLDLCDNLLHILMHQTPRQ